MNRSGKWIAPAVGLLSLFGSVALATAAPAYAGPQQQPGLPPADVTAPGNFTPLKPLRVLDTRTGTGPIAISRVNGGQTITFTPTSPDMPAGHEIAVALNVTAVIASQGTHVTVWPAGQPKPATSNLNVRPGETRANLVIAKLGLNGAVSLYNNSGQIDLVADLVGFYDDGTIPGLRYEPVANKRVFDTRDGTNTPATKICAGCTRNVKIKGLGVVPDTNQSIAVAVNVTAVDATADASHLTIYQDDTARPLASSLNFGKEATPNLVFSKLGQDGKIAVYNNSGSVDVVVDVVGYFTSGYAAGTSYDTLVPINPIRVLDSRTLHAANQPGYFGAFDARTFDLQGKLGVLPQHIRALVLNVTIVGPSQNTHVTVYPSNTARPNTSNLNAVAGQTVANMAIVPTNLSAHSDIYNNSGNSDVVVDVVGWVPDIL